MFYGTTCSGKFLTAVGERVPGSCCFIVMYIIDQQIILFYKRILRSKNIVLRVLSSLKCNVICALCSKYNIYCLSVTEYRIKEQLWSHFMDNLWAGRTIDCI